MSDNDLTKDMDDIEKGWQKERDTLKILLAKRKNENPNDIFVTKITSTGFSSYIGSLTFKKFATIGKFAHLLPWFQEHVTTDPDTNKPMSVKRSIKTLDIVAQRPIDYSRQFPMVDYLLSSRNHGYSKYPPITAVVLSQHSMKPDDPEFYDSDGKAIKSSTNFTALDDSGDIGILSLSEDNFIYALDGQHRLLSFVGIKELLESIDKELPKKKTDGTVIKSKEGRNVLRLEDFDFENVADVEEIFAQKVGVEFIPGVIKGETLQEANDRCRKFFVDYNDESKPLKKPDIIQLDDSDPYAIITKEMCKKNKFLSSAGKNIVDLEKKNPSPTSEFFTTLGSLVEAAKYLYGNNLTGLEITELSKKTSSEIKKIVLKEIGHFEDFINSISKLKDISDYSKAPKAKGTRARDYRQFSHHQTDLKENLFGHGHVLFRSAGLNALAHAYNNLVLQDRLTAKNFSNNLIKLSEADENFDTANKSNIAFLKYVSKPQSIFFGILYDFAKKKMDPRSESIKLAGNVLDYVLGPGDFADMELLRKNITERRTVGNQYIGWDGELKTLEIDNKEIKNPIFLPNRV